ncbi:hypothetical protein Tco_0011435 [Tanacetum coccineum]
MPIWCRMFQQTLDGSARGWFENLSRGSIDGWVELRQQFTTRFSTRRACFKDPTEITKIVRKANETLVAFKERCIIETGFITGVPEVMKISSFMDAYKCPELAKRYSDKVPKTVDEMMTRLDDFLRSKEAFASTELPKGEASEPSRKSAGPVNRREDRFHRGGYIADRQRNEGKNTFNNRDGLVPYRTQTLYQAPRDQGFYHPRFNLSSLTKLPKEILASEPQLNLQPPRSMQLPPKKQNQDKYCDYHGEKGHYTNDCFQLRRSWPNDRKRKSVERDESWMKALIVFPPLSMEDASDESLIIEAVMEGYLVRRDKLKIPLSGFLDNTLHGKVPTPRGIATLVTRSAITFECRMLERKQMVEQEVNQNINQEKEVPKRVDLTKQTLVNPAYPDQMVTIGGNLSEQCKNQLRMLLKKSMDVFALEPTDMTGIPRRIIKHSLNVNPSVEPVAQKRKVLSSDRTYVVSKEVEEWVNVGIIGRNLEAYVDDMVIKSNDEKVLIEDIAETFDNLQRINLKLNPKKCLFGVEEGKFLGDAELKWKAGCIKKILVPHGKGVPRDEKGHSRAAIANHPNKGGNAIHIRGCGNGGRKCRIASRKKGETMRLQRYFEAHPIKVITDQPLKHILNKAQASGKLAKYSVELGAYNIAYEPRNAMKGQVLADFLSEALLATHTFDHLTKKFLVEVLAERSTDQKEVGAIVEEEEDSWMTPIIRCLAEGVWPEDKDERRALRMKINLHVLEEGRSTWDLAECTSERGTCSCTKTPQNINDFNHGPMAILPMGNGHPWPSASSSRKVKVCHCSHRLLHEVDQGEAIGQNYRERRKEVYVGQHCMPMNTTVAHPQTNGLVEMANKSLMEGINARNEASRVEDQGKLGSKWEGPYRVTKAYQNGSYKLQTMGGKEVPRTWYAINLRKCYV